MGSLMQAPGLPDDAAAARPRRYRAFVSYSHADTRVATKLHRSLEQYRVPRRLRGTQGEFGTVPDTLAPIFCDREDFASAGDLGERMRSALADSDALIVVCSPQAAQSRWVDEEIRTFCRHGDARRVYCVIIAGEPHAGDDRECFPAALRDDGKATSVPGHHISEPIAADLRPGKDGASRARLKLIAGLLGVDLDMLRQRELQRRYRRVVAVAVTSLAGMALAIVLAMTAWIERDRAREQQLRAEVASATAERRQSQAEGLIGFLLDDLRPKLQKVGRLDLLDTVDERAEKYFASLPPGDFNDATLARQAQALTAIGQVRLSQARFREALDSFQNAYVRSSELADRHPRDGARLFDRGQAEYWVGFVYWQSRELDQAQTWWTNYRDTSRAVYALDPNNADWEHELAYGDHNVAVIALERGDLDHAADAFERATKTFESVLAKNPDDPQLMFDVADEISWQGNVQEQLGHLSRATELLADKSERLRAISARNATEPKWKVEWSTAQLMQAELLRIGGGADQALAVATEAVDRMKLLTALDPANSEWKQDYLYALLTRAGANVAAGKTAAAHADLGAAQPLLDTLAQTAADDRHVRRDLLDAASLRTLLAIRDRDVGAMQSAVGALRATDHGAATPTSAEDAGRYGLSLVAAARAASIAGRTAEADGYMASTRHALEPFARSSHYWRVLDPWARLSRSTGDVAEAERVETLLASYGYAPLFPWLDPKARGAGGSGDRAKSADTSPARPAAPSKERAAQMRPPGGGASSE